MHKQAYVLVVFIAALSLFVSASASANNKRAILVMDVDTGKILREENAHVRRYPASLTKMMTLYLLFDALRKDEISLKTKMTASKYAAKQPQTNISLKPGDKITVEQAIKALIVRSANDVAVVVAEHLGRSEWNFAVEMTQRARKLGMKNTVFRNPHGLPNSRQYTTAYDMALLSAALRRDFPQYYHYFKTKEFTFKRRTFKSHNRVIGKFAGVDGIKTGYIRASGFNLATSVKKDGFHIISIVLGGVSSRARDAEMVSILERTFEGLDIIKHRPRMVANAPASVLNPMRAHAEMEAKKQALLAQAKLEEAAQAPDMKLAIRDEPEQEAQPPSFSLRLGSANRTRLGASGHRSVQHYGEDTQEQIEEIASAAPEPAPVQVREAPRFSASVSFDPPKPAPAPEPRRTAFAPPPKEAPAPRKGTLEYQMAMIESGQGDVGYEPRTRYRGDEKVWGIQVGAFRKEEQARAAVKKAFGVLRRDVEDAYVTISSDGDQAAPIHRARLGNLSRNEADAACRKLAKMKQNCFALQLN